jgi:hypothetical protein
MMCIDAPMPKGVGIYVRNISRRIHGSPDDMAANARLHGVDFVALQCAWQTDDGKEHRDSNEGDLEDYAAALLAKGVEVGVWGYPHDDPQRIAEFTERCEEAMDQAQASFLLIDPEKPYKGNRDAAAALVGDVVPMCARRGVQIGVTSYGITSYHRTMPWQELGGVGFGSPQLYSVSKRGIRRGMNEWRAAGWSHLLPSVPAYGTYAGRKLRRRLEDYGDVPGVIVWSWRQLDGREWQALAAYSAARREAQ